METTVMNTVGLVVIFERKILLAFSAHKQAWYLPGGKVGNKESRLQALIREIKEELDLDLTQQELSYYGHISAPAFGESPLAIMEQDCYLHVLKGDPKPSGEVTALKYFDATTYIGESQVPGVLLLMKRLIGDDLID